MKQEEIVRMKAHLDIALRALDKIHGECNSSPFQTPNDLRKKFDDIKSTTDLARKAIRGADGSP